MIFLLLLHQKVNLSLEERKIAMKFKFRWKTMTILLGNIWTYGNKFDYQFIHQKLTNMIGIFKMFYWVKIPKNAFLKLWIKKPINCMRWDWWNILLILNLNFSKFAKKYCWWKNCKIYKINNNKIYNVSIVMWWSLRKRKFIPPFSCSKLPMQIYET